MSGLRRQHFLMVLALGLASAGGPPALAQSPTPAPERFDHPAQELVHRTTRQVFSALESDPSLKSAPPRVYALVDELVLPYFDLTLMSKRVLGRHWPRAEPAQRNAFVHEFRQMLVRTYSTALLSYSGETVRYLPSRPRADEGQVLVRTAIEGSGPVSIPVDYAMYRDVESWKVYDITIEGVSLVLTYRASFNNEVRDKGLDSLIARLRANNREA